METGCGCLYIYLVHAFITSRLDYGNSLFYGINKFQLERLQKIQNMAARIVMRSSKFDSTTSIRKELHWLPIEQRINFKVLVLAYRSVHKLAPVYLQELVSFYKPNRIRSDSQQL